MKITRSMYSYFMIFLLYEQEEPQGSQEMKDKYD